MGFFSDFKHEITQTINPSTYRGGIRRLESGEWWYPMGSGKDIKTIDPLTAFMVPEVNAILNKRATAKSNVKIQVVSKRTLEPMENNLSRLLSSPNWFQDQKEFINQSSLFRDLYGNEYLYLMFGIGLKPENTKVLTSLHPKFMKIDYKSQTRYYNETEIPEELRYIYTLGDDKGEFSADQIIHNNDNRVKFSNQNGEMLKGQTKLEGLSMPINNIIGAYEARGVLIRNRGALGILSNAGKDAIGSTLELDSTEKERLQSEYARYGVGEEQFQIIITSMALQWQQMGVDIEKLKLFEEVREDYIKIAESFNYPPELLAKEGSPNLFGDNKKQSRKAWYEDSIIPEVQEWLESLNKKFNTRSKPYTIIGTFDHLPFMQEDIKEKATTFTLVVNGLSRAYQDGAITLEQYQAELNKYGFIETDV